MSFLDRCTAEGEKNKVPKTLVSSEWPYLERIFCNFECFFLPTENRLIFFLCLMIKRIVSFSFKRSK